MATEKDLINAVRESLKVNGELGRIKAAMCTQVIELLDGSNKGNKVKLPKPYQDVILLNELIREYIDWMGYKYSSTVFTSECNLSKQAPSKFLLAQSLRLQESDDSKDLPLLCSILDTVKNLKNT
ncbi:centrosomal protein 20 [Hylaeus anthracinus]|uniref:centrosomal protein 20 n=1 Tax=Hylaeus volcanicus TaxID=313075 RepID=UPI0023B7D9A0|nr:centrosomal protein 20 [Hylaeus volcanicus]XP_053995848.1 centrosomal protein 20 [Hylaeus anthracinus]